MTRTAPATDDRVLLADGPYTPVAFDVEAVPVFRDGRWQGENRLFASRDVDALTPEPPIDEDRAPYVRPAPVRLGGYYDPLAPRVL